MDKENNDWLDNLLSNPVDEQVTAKLMEAPLVEIKARFFYFTELLQKLPRPLSRGLYFMVIIDNTPSHWIALDTGQKITVGRGIAADIRINHHEVSREHCVIFVRPDNRIELEDLHSKNGVLINDKRKTKAEINSGDIVRLGNTELIYVDYSNSSMDELRK